MRSLPATAVFSRADARVCGWSDPALTRAARSGGMIRLRQGLYTGAALDARALALAAAHACSGSVISHRSAALLYGLPLLGGAPERPDLTVEPRGTGDVAGALLHRARLGDDVEIIDGTAVTSPARTVVDLARTLPFTAAVVAADAALQRRLTTPHAIAAAAEACGGWPGIKRARRALAAVDGRAESPLESISRLAVARLDVPHPELQVLIRSEDDWVIGRTDFYWDDTGVAGEADGREKYSNRDVLTAEKLRQDDLEHSGVAVARWGWREARQIRLLETKIQRARERGRRRDTSGFPRSWSIQTTAPLTLPR
jgi:hypothetical protein